MHTWQLIFAIGEDAPNKSLDELSRCLSCGLIKHDYHHNGGQTSPSLFPVFWQRGEKDRLYKEPVCS